MSRNALLAFIIGVTVGAGVLVTISPAKADPPAAVACKALIDTNQASADKWKEAVQAWVAEGKTHFVNTPSGMCAW